MKLNIQPGFVVETQTTIGEIVEWVVGPALAYNPSHPYLFGLVAVEPDGSIRCSNGRVMTEAAGLPLGRMIPRGSERAVYNVMKATNAVVFVRSNVECGKAFLDVADSLRSEMPSRLSVCNLSSEGERKVDAVRFALAAPIGYVPNDEARLAFSVPFADVLEVRQSENGRLIRVEASVLLHGGERRTIQCRAALLTARPPECFICPSDSAARTASGNSKRKGG